MSKQLSVVLVLSLSLAPLSAEDATGNVIFSNEADGFLETRGDTVDDLPPSAPWPQVHGDSNGSFQGTVGEWFGSGPDGPGAYGLTTIVLPFQIPDLGAIDNPFATVDLGVMSNGQTFDNNMTDIDLYALDRIDSDPSLQPADWYSGANPDPNATLVQESFLTPSSPFGWDGAPNNFTDDSGDANLLSFMNAAYAGGANIGKYFFLRLSYGSDTFATGRDNYNINLREADATGFGAPNPDTEDPRITYTVVPEPGSVAIILGLLLSCVPVRRR